MIDSRMLAGNALICGSIGSDVTYVSGILLFPRFPVLKKAPVRI